MTTKVPFNLKISKRAFVDYQHLNTFLTFFNKKDFVMSRKGCNFAM